MIFISKAQQQNDRQVLWSVTVSELEIKVILFWFLTCVNYLQSLAFLLFFYKDCFLITLKHCSMFNWVYILKGDKD